MADQSANDLAVSNKEQIKTLFEAQNEIKSDLKSLQKESNLTLVSIKELAFETKQLRIETNAQNEKINELEKKPGQDMTWLIRIIIGIAISAILAIVFNKIGLTIN